MDIKYRKLMKDWNIESFDNPILDPAFVQPAKEFEEKLKNNELTDEEIKATDDELVVLFEKLHPQELIDSPEVTAANRKAEFAEAKNEIAEADSIPTLTGLSVKFSHLTELAPFIEKRIEKLTKANEASSKDKFTADALAEIKAAEYANLQHLFEKYKDHLELLKVIEARIEAEKPEPPKETLRDKLANAKKREWSYDDLRAIGIAPTGDNMEIEGVYLERQYMFYVYLITKVDGKRI